MKKLLVFLIILLTPSYVLAYSNKIIPGGETIGISVNCDGVLVIGFYEINGKINKFGLKAGDYITSVNKKKVNSINELTHELEKNVNEEKNIAFRRNGKELSTKIKLIYDKNKYKSGLYVKDKIVGIGTLSYIDPSTGIYGALGHEIIEAQTSDMVEIKSGNIFKSFVTSITPSTIGSAGSKNASIDYYSTYGSIFKNSNFGIYGKYDNYSNQEDSIMEILNNEDVKIGGAKIRTVLEGEEVKEYDINITNIHEYANSKNIEFEITDSDLLDKTGGVIQGMSGSPIIQNGKIAGVVTHVIVENPHNGYGIFITTMLKEGEK